MFLRASTRKKDGKTHRYWRLVENVRVGRRVIQRTVAQLGELDAQGRLRARALARHLIGSPEQGRLFDDGHADVAVPVRLKRIRIERPRQFGDVYLALALWRGTGLGGAVREPGAAGQGAGRLVEDESVLVAARLCEPSSELHIAEDWYRRTALSDLLQLPDDRSTRTGFTARSIISCRTRGRSRRICRSAAASCFVRTKCCSTMSQAPILRARRREIRWRDAATRAIIAPTASRCASRWW